MKKLLVAAVLFLSACTGSDVRQFVHIIENGTGQLCSAVTVRPGIALTADHCATVIGEALARGDDRKDIALIKHVGAKCPCPRIADREAELDETVYVVGYPRGIAQVLTIGASQGVHENSRMPYGRRLVTTALVGPGNSGGGVFVFRNGEFQLVGILVESDGHLSFAVPLADIKPFLAEHLGYVLH